MENKLLILKTEKDLVEKLYSVKYDNLIQGLDHIIDKYFVKPFDAKCVRRWIREESYPQRGICINFELGFYNTEEDRIDFGSDMYFMYNSITKCLEVNYGTCGSYSKKDTYQVKRVKTIAHVWDNIDEIESELDNYAVEITPEILSRYDKIYDIEHEILSIEQQIQSQKEAAVTASLEVGKVLYYNEDCTLTTPHRYFYGAVKVEKVTPKFVIMRDNYDREIRVKKDHIVAHALKNYISIE